MRLTVAEQIGRAGRCSAPDARRRSRGSRRPSSACSASRRRSFVGRTSRASRWSSGSSPTRPSLTLQFLRCGAETVSTERNDELAGAPKGDPVPIDWTGKRSGPVTITVQTGAWPTGVYAARLTTDDGRVGFAPFVLRAADDRSRGGSSS